MDIQELMSSNPVGVILLVVGAVVLLWGIVSRLVKLALVGLVIAGLAFGAFMMLGGDAEEVQETMQQTMEKMGEQSAKHIEKAGKDAMDRAQDALKQSKEKMENHGITEKKK